jgi:F-type H+-transporting ATPase subunit a
MHQEHELWFTALLNQTFAGPANQILSLVGIHAHDPAKPWTNFMAMQILVALIFLAVFGLLRASLSMAKPGVLQQFFEVVYEFLADQAHGFIGHDWKRHMPIVCLLFFFILFSNLLGIIPGFESPTMSYYVPCGCALLVLIYYNVQGFKENGIGYLLHFAGPTAKMGFFGALLGIGVFGLEIISHLFRPVSLTIRLFANMLAGEQVTVAFLALAPWGPPALFMALHTFVSFMQAYVFTVLTMVYIGGAVEHEH